MHLSNKIPPATLEGFVRVEVGEVPKGYQTAAKHAALIRSGTAPLVSTDSDGVTLFQADELVKRAAEPDSYIAKTVGPKAAKAFAGYVRKHAKACMKELLPNMPKMVEAALAEYGRLPEVGKTYPMRYEDGSVADAEVVANGLDIEIRDPKHFGRSHCPDGFLVNDQGQLEALGPLIRI